MRIIGQVFEETNYDAFAKLPDNRDLSPGRLNKLIASISERYILNPIIVNEKMEIIDGQGRFNALKTLGMPIHYVISPGATNEDCRRMNKYNTAWSVLDFAKSHATAGKKSYVLLLLACKETKYPISTILRLTNHGTRSNKDGYKDKTYSMSAYEKGELKFDENDVQTAKTIRTLSDEIIDALQFAGRTNEAFITAVKIASETPGYNHEKMLKNCRLNRSSYTQMSSLGDQLVEFERIYNYKTPSRTKLYFSDYMRNKGRNVRSYENNYSPYNDSDVSELKRIEEK